MIMNVFANASRCKPFQGSIHQGPAGKWGPLQELLISTNQPRSGNFNTAGPSTITNVTRTLLHEDYFPSYHITPFCDAFFRDSNTLYTFWGRSGQSEGLGLFFQEVGWIIDLMMVEDLDGWSWSSVLRLGLIWSFEIVVRLNSSPSLFPYVFEFTLIMVSR